MLHSKILLFFIFFPIIHPAKLRANAIEKIAAVAAYDTIHPEAKTNRPNTAPIEASMNTDGEGDIIVSARFPSPCPKRTRSKYLRIAFPFILVSIHLLFSNFSGAS